MAKKPDWVSIRADYEIENLGIRDLERKYSVSSSTIATRMKKEEWQKNRYEQKISNVVNTINDISEQANEQERARIYPKINSAVELLKHMNSFIDIAARINVQTISELEQQDLPTRVMGLNKLKATMPELANMVGIQKEIAIAEKPEEISEETKEDTNGLVTFYMPKNGRD